MVLAPSVQVAACPREMTSLALPPSSRRALRCGTPGRSFTRRWSSLRRRLVGHACPLLLDVPPNGSDEVGNELGQANEQLRERSRGLLEVSGLVLDELYHSVRVEVEEVAKELVGGLRLDSIREVAKVVQIVRNDHLSPGFDGRSRYVPVLLVVLHRGFQRLIPRDQGLREGARHGREEVFRLCGRHCFRVDEVPDRLVQDLLGPIGLEQAFGGRSEEGVP